MSEKGESITQILKNISYIIGKKGRWCMSKKLVIVESPHKSKTIEKYLGKEFKVVSSLGHIRDLSTAGKYGFGVDIDNDFKPDYKIIKGV